MDNKAFEQIYSLKEGTWSFEPEYADEAILKIKELKKWLYGKFGDDILFDYLDNSIERIEVLSQLKLER